MTADADLRLAHHFHPLRDRPHLIASECPVAVAQLLAQGGREGAQGLRRDRRADLDDMRKGAPRIALRVVARRRQLGDAILERRIAYVDDAVLDRVVEAFELRFRLGRTPLKVGDMLAALVHPLVAPFEDLIHQHFEPRRVE
ncbi:hypothetical protein [Sphingopyxis macrogoltabida]|uniref:Uncharacterized protein n=1 Tax=Sphingopyxis macrogoltabida TaxID=33050 RepID=A0AAC9FFQ7_SPHMC|nr:hypothetical protein [Sphingopyxis macrogoltabida]AMU90140.1 hypothetical protein ATM17_13965 [Sphingopyxis macrogoltabida]